MAYRLSLAQHKYFEFLLPNTIMVFAMSISEFVDVFLVSWMLGNEAMAVVNLGNPIMFIVSTVAILFSIGGAARYSQLVGEYHQEEATRVFSASVYTVIAVATMLMLLMLIFLDPLVHMLCAGHTETIVLSKDYIAIMIVSLPVLTISNLLFGFLPAIGQPSLSSKLLIGANVLNLVLDIVYIRFLNLGVEGAILATVTAYTMALAVFLWMWARGRIGLKLCHMKPAWYKVLGSVFSLGIPSSLGQLSFSIKYAFCNAMAIFYGGITGNVVFTVCIQLLSFASIFVGGIGSTFINIASFLKGQNDLFSMRRVCLLSYGLQFVCSVLYTAAFCIFAREIALLYSVHASVELHLCIKGIQLFSVCLIPRGITIIFMFYVQIQNRTLYASTISLIDGFVGIIPVCGIMCLIFGFEGLLMSFGITNILLLFGILCYNTYLLIHNHNKYTSILLFEMNQKKDTNTMYSTCVLHSDTDVNTLLNDKLEMLIPDQFELIRQYLVSLLNANKKEVRLDLAIELHNERLVCINFRTSYGRLTQFTPQLPENMINSVAMGMNCLRVTL